MDIAAFSGVRTLSWDKENWGDPQFIRLFLAHPIMSIATLDRNHNLPEEEINKWLEGKHIYSTPTVKISSTVLKELEFPSHKIEYLNNYRETDLTLLKTPVKNKSEEKKDEDESPPTHQDSKRTKLKEDSPTEAAKEKNESASAASTDPSLTSRTKNNMNIESEDKQNTREAERQRTQKIASLGREINHPVTVASNSSATSLNQTDSNNDNHSSTNNSENQSSSSFKHH